MESIPYGCSSRLGMELIKTPQKYQSSAIQMFISKSAGASLLGSFIHIANDDVYSLRPEQLSAKPPPSVPALGWRFGVAIAIATVETTLNPYLSFRLLSIQFRRRRVSCGGVVCRVGFHLFLTFLMLE